jgi:hypothetical protein
MVVCVFIGFLAHAQDVLQGCNNMNLNFDHIQYRIIFFPSTENSPKDLYIIYPVVEDLDTNELMMFSEEGAVLCSTSIERLQIESFNFLDAFNHPPIHIDDIQCVDLSDDEPSEDDENDCDCPECSYENNIDDHDGDYD